MVHTLILCRHGDSIWNGGEPGCRETFTGWTNVPLSSKGVREAQNTGRQVSQFEMGIDACFTSILQRAQLTAHYCLWAFWGADDKPDAQSPRRYVSDYRLNERHYGALQGLVKEDVEKQYATENNNATIVQAWRRSWYTVPPLLRDDDPRRQQELQAYVNYCGGDPENVPRGESLDQVAEHRIRPFLAQVLCPVLEQAALGREANCDSHSTTTKTTATTTATNTNTRTGGTGLVVAHANSLRALIGVLTNAQTSPTALAKLEALRLQTGVPLVLRFQSWIDPQQTQRHYRACDLNFSVSSVTATSNDNAKDHANHDNRDHELPVYPLSSLLVMKSAAGIPSDRVVGPTVPF